MSKCGTKVSESGAIRIQRTCRPPRCLSADSKIATVRTSSSSLVKSPPPATDSVTADSVASHRCQKNSDTTDTLSLRQNSADVLARRTHMTNRSHALIDCRINATRPFGNELVRPPGLGIVVVLDAYNCIRWSNWRIGINRSSKLLIELIALSTISTADVRMRSDVARSTAKQEMSFALIYPPTSIAQKYKSLTRVSWTFRHDSRRNAKRSPKVKFHFRLSPSSHSWNAFFRLLTFQ